MPFLPSRIASAVLLCLVSAVPAHASTLIDFNGPALTGLYFPGETIASGGYNLTVRNDFGLVDVAAALGQQAPSGNASQFYFASNDGQLEVSSAANIPFRLGSFSAAFVALDTPSAQVTAMVAVGSLQGGGSRTAWWPFATGTLNSSPFASYTLPADFGDLVSLSFRACSLVGSQICTEPTLNNGQFAIDDIFLTPVPEPTPAALLALGGALLALHLRSRRRPV